MIRKDRGGKFETNSETEIRDDDKGINSNDGVISTIRDSESLIIRVMCGSSGQSIADSFDYSSYQPGFPFSFAGWEHNVIRKKRRFGKRTRTKRRSESIALKKKNGTMSNVFYSYRVTRSIETSNRELISSRNAVGTCNKLRNGMWRVKEHAICHLPKREFFCSR